MYKRRNEQDEIVHYIPKYDYMASTAETLWPLAVIVVARRVHLVCNLKPRSGI